MASGRSFSRLPNARANHAAGVRRDDGHLVQASIVDFTYSPLELFHRVEIVGRNVEKPLDLACVEINREHAVGPAVVMRLATSLAEIGVRGPALRSYAGQNYIRPQRDHEPQMQEIIDAWTGAHGFSRMNAFGHMNGYF